MVICFLMTHLGLTFFSYRWLRRRYSRSTIKKKKGFFFLYCSHLFVPLASPKVLSFDNKKEKRVFFLYCSHLFVPLQTE